MSKRTNLFSSFLILTILCLSIPPSTANIESRTCDKTKSPAACDPETVERFGCCPAFWEEYEGVVLEGAPLDVVYCNPGGGNVTVECKKVADAYKDIGKVVCASLPLEIKDSRGKIIRGRCRYENEDRVIHNYVYKDLKFYDKRKLIKRSTLGEKCNTAMYIQRGIRELWERYLTCPFDTDYIDERFSKILEEAAYSPIHLAWLCLESRNIEECVNDTCTCLQFETDVPNRTKSSLEKYVWKFNQKSEVKNCGQIAENPCTYNIKDLVNEEEPYKSICKIKGADVKGRVVLDELPCENDAICESKTTDKQYCSEEEDCVCKCVEGRQCKSSALPNNCIFIVLVFWTGLKFTDQQ